jgi:3-hydroxyacyl-[acyl-carrier-protein] dehydratase
MTGSVVGRFVVPADHPSLPGHFPGRPIVPGVVLLDHVLALVAGPRSVIAALPSTKFIAAVAPGEMIEVTADPPRAGRIGFVATRAGRIVLRGTVDIATVDTA